MAQHGPRVAFLGLGVLGAAMAMRLHQSGLQVVGWNRTQAKADELARAGLTLAATAEAAARDADVVCLCLLDAGAVQRVLFSDGMRLRTGAVLLDFSTISVEPTRLFAAELARRFAADWVDAPVSGGVAGATRGTLTIFCGGEAAAVERARPVLQAVGSRVTHLGGSGAGQAAKLCNQLIVASNVVAVAEAVALARGLELDPALLVEALAGGFADSAPLRIFGPRMARPGTHQPVGTVGTMAKDVVTVAHAARTAGASLALLTATEQIYAAALRDGLGDEEIDRIVALYGG